MPPDQPPFALDVWFAHERKHADRGVDDSDRSHIQKSPISTGQRSFVLEVRSQDHVTIYHELQSSVFNVLEQSIYARSLSGPSTDVCPF